MFHAIGQCFILASLLLTAGCAALDRNGVADSLARNAGLTRAEVKTDSFLITTFARLRDPAAPIVFYIEGDGLAYRSRSEVSSDPTPIRPTGLRLAALDPSPNLVHIARPCQYTPVGRDPRCNQNYWTLLRYSEEVVASVDQTIAHFVGMRNRGIRLVGYSGGAAVAALVAARRFDVIDLRTIAGNLDHEYLNRLHGVSQLKGSLNAADLAGRLVALPQLHLVGTADRIVPPAVVESYLTRLGDRRCAELRRIPGATHEDGWQEIWPEIVKLSVTCRTAGR